MRTFAFHQKFSLHRERLSLMLRCIADGAATSEDAVASYMGVNPYMVEGFRGWLCKTGLGNATKSDYHLSPVGHLLAQHDPTLERDESLWLMHYALANSDGERAEVWYRFINEIAAVGTQFTRATVQTYVERSVEELPKNTKAIQHDAQEMIKSYTRTEGLAGLGFVQQESKTDYRIIPPQEPQPIVVAYVLLDSWMRRYPHIDTLRLSQVCVEPEMPGKIFLAPREHLIQALRHVQALGLIALADTQHEPVTRRFREPPIRLLTDYFATL